MYKLNVKRGETRRYTAVVKRKFFRLWLIVGKAEFDTKRECREFFRATVSY